MAVIYATIFSLFWLLFLKNYPYSYQSFDDETKKKAYEDTKALNWDFIFNEDKALAAIEYDLKIIEAIDEELKRREEEKEKSDAANSSDGIDGEKDLSTAKMNLAEILDSLKFAASPTFIADAKRISGVEDAVKFAKEHKGL